jgi:hypothetical protein
VPDRRHVLRALEGAWRLARVDPKGLGYFEFDADGFWSSFYAAVVVLPLHLLVLVVLPRPDGIEPGLGRLAVELGFYVLSWIDFPIVAIFLTRFLGLSRGYVPLVVVSNWVSVWQSVLMTPVQILAGLGVLGGFGDVVVLSALAAALVYQWYATRLALGTTPWTAAAFVVVDLVLGIALAIASEALR